ncbi:MAG: hypothetical protein GY822_03070 [Deltaproteobacteria bacterium]|nr:hypothetical protein [Deltaproteobacteria bacterium]
MHRSVFFAFSDWLRVGSCRRKVGFLSCLRPKILLSLFLLTTLSSSLAAKENEVKDVARFALVIGANQSIDEDLPVLSFADDDAARYFDLFQTLKVPTRLVATLDNSTAKLHPDASVVALPSVGASLDVQILGLVADVKRAHDDDKHVEVFVVFAGHGNHKNGRGYLTLEDRRIQGKELFVDLVDSIDADRTHLIVDACYSFLLTRDRGPGGRRKAAQGFATMSNLADRGVGLFLSTSSATRSHEWAGFQAGVFSHEIRSGLYGAADVDRRRMACTRRGQYQCVSSKRLRARHRTFSW